MDYSAKLQEVGGKFMSWIKSSDTTYLQKGAQVAHIYGYYTGGACDFLSKQLLKIESPDKRITGAAGKLSHLLLAHGNYMRHKAPTWQLVIHAYLTYRVARETIGYVQRLTSFPFRKKQSPIEQPQGEEEIPQALDS